MSEEKEEMEGIGICPTCGPPTARLWLSLWQLWALLVIISVKYTSCVFNLMQYSKVACYDDIMDRPILLH